MDDPLYRRALLRLAADARGAGQLPHADATGHAHNPACGDRVTVELALADGRVTALAHQTNGCVLTQASAALLADMADGLDRDGLARLAAAVRAMLAGGAALPGYEAFEGVGQHPGRQTCVLLPLQAALSALQQAEEGAAGSQGQAGAV